MSPAKKKPSSPTKATRASKTKAKKSAAQTVRKATRTTSSRTPSSKAAGAASARIAEVNETVKMVRDLAAVVERRSLTELVVETKEATYSLRREPAPSLAQITGMPALPGPAPAPAVAAAADAEAEAKQEDPGDEHHVITSPFVGTFYRRPNPDADAYAEVGQYVDKGQVLCIVEAMKLMNEIEADAAGLVVAVLVDDAEPVEYGQSLFKIDPS